MLTLNPISGAFDMVGLTQTSADARYVKKSGDVMTGLLQFSGTTHAGLQLNSLTTTQRDSLTPANGMLLYNSNATQIQKYENSQWVDVSKSPATKVVAPVGSGYAADYYTTGTADNVVINAALLATYNAGGGSVKLMEGCTFTISATLVTYSNVRLIAYGATINLASGANVTMLEDSDHKNATGSVDHISVWGGVWNAGTLTHPSGNVYCMLLGGSRLDIRDLEFKSAGTEGFSLVLHNTTDFYVENIFFNNVSSDGLHITGPSARGCVKNIYGYTYDDMVVLGNNDANLSVAGDITDVFIDGIRTNGFYRANVFKILSGTALSGSPVYNTKRIHVKNISGTMASGYLSGIYIGDDANFSGTKNGQLDNITIENVSLSTPNGNTRPIFYFKGSSTSLTIPNIKINKVDVIGDMTAVFQLEQAKIVNLDISNVTGSTGSAGMTGVVYFAGGSAGSAITNLTLNTINITQVGSAAGQLLTTFSSSGDTLTNAYLSNVYLNNFDKLADTVLSTVFYLSNMRMVGNGEILHIRSGASIIVQSCNGLFADNITSSIISTGTLESKSVSFPLNINDAQVVMTNTGDAAYNNNSTATTPIGSLFHNIFIKSSGLVSSLQINDDGTFGAGIVLRGSDNKFLRSRQGKFQIIDNAYVNALLTILDGGRVGIGNANIVPTAWLHLPAGVSGASGAPLKFTSGTNLTTPEAGTMEFDGSHLYFTIGATRYQIDQQSAAAGDIVGPASAVDSNVVFFDGTTGKLVKDSGLTLSGSNTGDQTITLTGNVTGSGTGSFATTIAAGVVTNSMLAGSITASNLVGTDITTVGTISTGTWQGTKVSEGYGGTNQSTYTLGDVLYSSASNTLSKLAGNTTATKKFLRQTGNGTISAAPAWDTLVAGDIPDLSGTYQPLDSDLTTIAGLTATTDNFLVSVSSAWASRTPTQVKSTLSLGNVENTALSTWAGTSNITTLGTIGTGTWQGTAINRAYVTGLLQSDISGLTTASSPTFVALTLSGASVFTSAAAANVIPLTINQNDTTNNPTALLIANTGSGVSLDMTAPNIAAGGSTANLRIFSTTSQAVDTGGSIGLGGYITGTSTSQMHGEIAARKENGTSTNTRAYMQFTVVNQERMRIDSNGRLGFGGAGPVATNVYTYDLGWVTTAAKTIGMERMTTAATAGQSLTITSQGAKSGSTNKAGGNLILGSGISTGSGTGNVQIQATGNTAGSTSDNSLSTIATFDITGVALTTKIITYNNISTVSNGIPSEVATIDTTGLTANVGATTLYATPATAGMYRVSAYVVETTAGSLSSTLPNVQIVYTDSDSNTSVTIDATPVLGVAGIGQTGALTANTVGTVSTGVIVLYVKASTTIQYQTVNYASNLSGMTYALRIKLEAL